MKDYQDIDVLLWRARDTEANDWQVLEPAPASNRAFVETQRYMFQGPFPGWSLHIDDEPLRALAGAPSTWEWQPGFFAGEVTAELRTADGQSAGLFLLDVAPDPAKIGQVFFAEMVNDLWEADPTYVLGDEPGTTATGELGLLEDPWLAFARLRRYTPEFFRALTPIRRSPRRTLQVRRDSAPLHHARRVDQRTAISMLRSASVAMFFAHPDDAPPVPQESRVDVPVIEDTVDAAANRAMCALILALLRRTQIVLERLDAAVDHDSVSDTRTPLAGRWPARKQFLEDTRMQLASLLRQFPFTEIRRPETTAAGLTAIAADPIYSRAWGRGWRALRHGIESEIKTERLWVSPSWEIYERWCFLQIGKLLERSTPTWHWSQSRNPRCYMGMGPDVQARLLLQPTFGAHATKQHGMWSISKERVPDIVLVVEARGTTRFLVVDAKYRTTRSAVLDAMESAHIYHDSLRIGNCRPDATLLVVPALSDTTWLTAPDFISEHRVGIFSLSPATLLSLPHVMLNTLGFFNPESRFGAVGYLPWSGR
jgi:hypothetical protein